MRIIPVLDVMGGQVVRAVAGRRHEYRPIQSLLTHSSRPLEVADVLLSATVSRELYIADLDAIRYGTLSSAINKLIDHLNACILLDAGKVELPRQHERVRRIIPLEACFLPDEVERIVRDSSDAIFSIDLMDGVLLGNWPEWELANDRDVRSLARKVVDAGFRSLLVLDLHSVGRGRGPSTLEFCAAIRAELSDVELMTGGGVRNWDDVQRLEDAGADAVLVATAIHEGRLHCANPQAD